MEARRKIAVAGATGRVGRHVVEVLEAGGHDVVAMSRSSGVDVVAGDGLAEALAGVECVIDVATGSSPEQVLSAVASLGNSHGASRAAGERAAPEVRFLRMPVIDVSSSIVRERAALGEPLEPLVGGPVARYIEEHGLYRSAGGSGR